jgi:hypothetical protein
MFIAGEVEAKNFVLNIGHLWDGRELVVQPTISSKKEVASMRRIVLVLTVALVMAAMVVATAAPAFAVKLPLGHPNPCGIQGHPTTYPFNTDLDPQPEAIQHACDYTWQGR